MPPYILNMEYGSVQVVSMSFLVVPKKKTKIFRNIINTNGR